MYIHGRNSSANMSYIFFFSSPIWVVSKAFGNFIATYIDIMNFFRTLCMVVNSVIFWGFDIVYLTRALEFYYQKNTQKYIPVKKKMSTCELFIFWIVLFKFDVQFLISVFVFYYFDITYI